MHVKENLNILNVWVVDLDNGLVGNSLTRVAEEMDGAPGHHITFTVQPSGRFDDYLAVRRGVYNNHAWGAITILPGATSRLRDAIDSRNISYDPSEACEVVVVSGRDQGTLQAYIMPALQEFQVKALSAFGQTWVSDLLSGSVDTASLAAVPQAVNPGIGFTQIDLRPFGPPQVIPWTSVALIYLIIIAFFSYSFFMPTHTHFVNEMEGHREIQFHHLIMWKYLSTLGAYFFMSFAYSVVPLMFEVPLNEQPAAHDQPVDHANAYGRGSFPVLWAINFLGMCALGYACENVAMLVGQPWTALWLIFWVISNVATAFYPVVLASGVYQYGYAFPLHHVVDATRTVLFDVHSTMGLDLGVLVAWWAVNTALFPIAAWWLRHQVIKPKTMQGRNAAEAGKV
jgi:hypothetical protein